MRKAVITGPETIEFWETPVPEPGVGQVLVRVHAVGICTMERRFYDGGEPKYPFHGGHEICGEVVRCGPGVAEGYAPGQKIVVASLTRCGECHFCKRGLDHMCENADEEYVPGKLWGPAGLAEFMLVRGYEVYPVRNDLDSTQGTLAEPLACVIRSLGKARLQFGDTVVIQGAGVMGVLHARLARLAGATIVVSEPDERRRQNALRGGAHHVCDPRTENLRELVLDLTNGRGAEGCFFTAGGNAAIEEGMRCLAKCGTLVLYGSVRPATPVGFIPNDVHYDEIVITGAIRSTRDSFRKAALLLESERIDVSDLVSEVFPVRKLDEAFRRARDLDTYRVVVRFDES